MAEDFVQNFRVGTDEITPATGETLAGSDESSRTATSRSNSGRRGDAAGEIDDVTAGVEEVDGATATVGIEADTTGGDEVIDTANEIADTDAEAQAGIDGDPSGGTEIMDGLDRIDHAGAAADARVGVDAVARGSRATARPSSSRITTAMRATEPTPPPPDKHHRRADKHPQHHRCVQCRCRAAPAGRSSPWAPHPRSCPPGRSPAPRAWPHSARPQPPPPSASRGWRSPPVRTASTPSRTWAGRPARRPGRGGRAPRNTPGGSPSRTTRASPPRTDAGPPAPNKGRRRVGAARPHGIAIGGRERGDPLDQRRDARRRSDTLRDRGPDGPLGGRPGTGRRGHAPGPADRRHRERRGATSLRLRARAVTERRRGAARDGAGPWTRSPTRSPTRAVAAGETPAAPAPLIEPGRRGAQRPPIRRGPAGDLGRGARADRRGGHRRHPGVPGAARQAGRDRRTDPRAGVRDRGLVRGRERAAGGADTATAAFTERAPASERQCSKNAEIERGAGRASGAADQSPRRRTRSATPGEGRPEPRSTRPPRASEPRRRARRAGGRAEGGRGGCRCRRRRQPAADRLDQRQQRRAPGVHRSEPGEVRRAAVVGRLHVRRDRCPGRLRRCRQGRGQGAGGGRLRRAQTTAGLSGPGQERAGRRRGREPAGDGYRRRQRGDDQRHRPPSTRRTHPRSLLGRAPRQPRASRT